jgi:hypothetical protein
MGQRQGKPLSPKSEALKSSSKKQELSLANQIPLMEENLINYPLQQSKKTIGINTVAGLGKSWQANKRRRSIKVPPKKPVSRECKL